MSRLCWIILTGEYPPKVGGVADYTSKLAQELAAAGDEVHIWAPGPCTQSDNITVHTIPDCYGPFSLLRLTVVLNKFSKEHRLLVQYVPHAFGWKAMNLLFCIWLWGRRKRSKIWIMFHEVCFPKLINSPLKLKFLRYINELMARLLISSAERIFISVAFWKEWLNEIYGSCVTSTVLPVPSNLPTELEVSQLQQHCYTAVKNGDDILLGYFGTCPANICEYMEPVIVEILDRNPNAKVILIGEGSSGLREKLARLHERLEPRIYSTGRVDEKQAAIAIAACDLMFYPFPDGVSGRRTSLLAALALGKPIVTSAGLPTESFWRESKAVVLVEQISVASMVERIEELMRNRHLQSDLQKRAKELYKEKFSSEHAIAILRSSYVCRFD